MTGEGEAEGACELVGDSVRACVCVGDTDGDLVWVCVAEIEGVLACELVREPDCVDETT